jgi:hypothetical protein
LLFTTSLGWRRPETHQLADLSWAKAALLALTQRFSMSVSLEHNSGDKTALVAQAHDSKLGSQLLEAWHDKVAGVTAFSGAVTTTSLFGDGHRLVVADEDRKLKVACTFQRS